MQVQIACENLGTPTPAFLCLATARRVPDLKQRRKPWDSFRGIINELHFLHCTDIPGSLTSSWLGTPFFAIVFFFSLHSFLYSLVIVCPSFNPLLLFLCAQPTFAVPGDIGSPRHVRPCLLPPRSWRKRGQKEGLPSHLAFRNRASYIYLRLFFLRPQCPG